MGLDGAGSRVVYIGNIDGEYNNDRFFINSQSQTMYATGADPIKFGINTPDPTAALDVVGTVVFQTTHTPSSSTDTGITGQIAWDASYIYICIATDTWVRSALTTW